MGACCSDVRGGQQAVGGGQQRSQAADGGHNDAVEFLFRSKGVHALFTQIENLSDVIVHDLTCPNFELQLSLSASKLVDRDIVSKCCLIIMGPLLCVEADSYLVYGQVVLSIS
ncbi:hypothetical protein U1Q18_004168 [Sarracenia purpurea var. burkii]